MKYFGTFNKQRIIYNFKCCLLLNKMVLVKSFLTGVLYDDSELLHVYLNESYKIQESCNC